MIKWILQKCSKLLSNHYSTVTTRSSQKHQNLASLDRIAVMITWQGASFWTSLPCKFMDLCRKYHSRIVHPDEFVIVFLQIGVCFVFTGFPCFRSHGTEIADFLMNLKCGFVRFYDRGSIFRLVFIFWFGVFIVRFKNSSWQG